VVLCVWHAMMALCTRCERFDLQSFTKGFFSRTYDFSAVNIHAVSDSCSFCCLLLESLDITAYTSLGERSLRSPFRLPPRLLIQFWTTPSQDSLIGGSGLRMTHLNAAIGERWWGIQSSAEEIISFHTEADPGEHSLS
jgi:hypothetical protein